MKTINKLKINLSSNFDPFKIYCNFIRLVTALSIFNYFLIVLFVFRVLHFIIYE